MRIAFAIPGDINLPTGGYAYDRRVMHELRQAGIAVDHITLPGSFPYPSIEDLDATARVLASVDRSSVLLVDGLAYGAFPEALARSILHPIVALVHHPLACETGLSSERQIEFHLRERVALSFARKVVVTSPMTARTVAKDFAVQPSRISVAPPGTDPARRARGTGRPLQLLSVGSIVPRKAYDVLVNALAQSRLPDWRLDIIGAARSVEAGHALAVAIRDNALAGHITVAGAVPQAVLEQRYDAADLFVLPSLYEGFGMVLTEAVARGLPIVCTTGGAAAETVSDQAAIKVPPGDVHALAAALERVLCDSDLRAAMAEASWLASPHLQRWNETAHVIARAASEVVAT